MKYKVKIEFELDSEEYEGVNNKNDAKACVEDVIEGGADWTGNEVITIE